MQRTVDSELIRSLKTLAEKLGLDVSLEHFDKHKINLTIEAGADSRTEIACFKSTQTERALDAARHFEILLRYLGAIEIKQTLSKVSFRHFPYMSSLNYQLAEVLEDLKRAGTADDFHLETLQGAYNLRKLIYERLLMGMPATTEWRNCGPRETSVLSRI